MQEDPITRPIAELSAKLRANKLRSADLAENALDRIARFDGKLESFVCVADDARAQAAAADREIAEGRWRGHLHGVPVAIKDNYLTANMPTGAGTDARGVEFARQDSAVVARLRAAGAVIIGKTRMHEFAWGNVTPPAKNPWDTSRVPGGSSGGSGAAVAARIVPMAMGSDTGGSIRIPAALCGTVGLKPTFGRVSRAGIVPHSWSLDHAGPLSYTVADSAHTLNAISGHDPNDPGSARIDVPDFSAALGQPVAGLRIGICRNHMFDSNQPDVGEAIESAIRFYRDAGAHLVEFELPILAFGLGAIFAIELSSSTAYHSRNLASGAAKGFTDDVRTLVEMGRMVSGADYLKAEQLRRTLIDDLAKVFADVDVIIGPTCPLTAWPIGEWSVRIGDQDESVLAASWRLTYPWNLAGLPAISLPCGFDSAGLPIGLQLAARPFDEANLIRAADAYERSHDWKDISPKLST
ncbi:Asp-tRNA(Asn)/Glu-tRNA(Gln) amidotransferase subunit GatA [Bradyrhizobium lablabi]|uniref:amidase n=1 Tax=Bradyrhizobium lablabi TaxID=722472 RepID=UPI001BA6A24E|nr:amidase [Bradyrhizobium lablabi]MBR1126077.1 Asp-tRNA(Asn)/Glu-tRNA(Gln) amidotransferase subunit GatA [Bradyrhizobium lablabi]